MYFYIHASSLKEVNFYEFHTKFAIFIQVLVMNNAFCFAIQIWNQLFNFVDSDFISC